MREIFKRFLELEATPDADDNDPKGQAKFDAAGQEMDAMWDQLTPAEQLYHETGHQTPLPE